MRERGPTPLPYAQGTGGQTTLRLGSLAVYTLPVSAAVVSLIPLWFGPDPGRHDDALAGVILGVAPSLVLAACQFLVVVVGLRPLKEVLVVLSVMGAFGWGSLLLWRVSIQFGGPAPLGVGVVLGSAYAFLAFASALAAANAIVVFRAR